MVKIRNLRSFEPFDIFVLFMLGVFALLIVVPLYYIVVLSFTTFTQYIKSAGLVVFPLPISLDGYKQFLTNPAVPRSFYITVMLTIVGTALNMVLTVTMAYPLSRKELPCRKFFTLFAFIPMVFSGGLIPTFYMVRWTGIMDTFWAMIVPSLISCYNLTITRSFFQSIDNAYIEAARIDGANEFTILVRVILPLAKPVLATILLMYGVMHWNTFISALYYVRRPDLQPLQVVLRGILMQAQSTLEETSVEMTASSQAMKQAAVVLSALPVVIVYPFLQKYFTKGMLLGGVKG
ncbi:MAG TPA: carbohydrate ABC transporter permease [Rectinemataceae bacterium]|nr:carbohydrate ABC transporter permease [Rectinemataceae bacterium]